MAKGSIYLKTISCKGIKSLIPFQKPTLYAVVSLSGAGKVHHRHTTPVDPDGGDSPEWDCSLCFQMDGPDLIIQFDLKAQIPILGDRIAGSAHIPVSDLAGDDPGRGASTHHVSYQVRSPDGKANGVLDLWYRIEQPETHNKSLNQGIYYSPAPSAPVLGSSSAPWPDVRQEPVVCYPPVQPNAVYPPMEPDPIQCIHSKAQALYDPIPAYYPPPAISNHTQEAAAPECYPPPDSGPVRTTYYPPPGRHYPLMSEAVGGSPYYPPPGTKYAPSESSSTDERREAEEPVVAYPPVNAFYPPAPVDVTWYPPVPRGPYI